MIFLKQFQPLSAVFGFVDARKTAAKKTGNLFAHRLLVFGIENVERFEKRFVRRGVVEGHGVSLGNGASSVWGMVMVILAPFGVLSAVIVPLWLRSIIIRAM